MWHKLQTTSSEQTIVDGVVVTRTSFGFLAESNNNSKRCAVKVRSQLREGDTRESLKLVRSVAVAPSSSDTEDYGAEHHGELVDVIPLEVSKLI